MAKRDKLTHRQKRQVAAQLRRKLKKTEELPQFEDLSAAQDGLLVSRFGEQADVISLIDDKKYRCFLRQNLGSPVPGDKVSFRLDPQNQGVVEALYERHSELGRPSAHQGVKIVAANINLVFVVVAPLPDFSSMLLDRYLTAVRNANLDAVIVANKWDLSGEIEAQNITAQLEIYHKLGYRVVQVSTKNENGIEQISELAQSKHSILVGQSGVGKSSIINLLFPHQQSLVNEVSGNSRLGQHTTTASQLFLFPNREGFIVDSPGIREFGLWHLEQPQICNGFIEFEPYIGGCKFRDCTHVNEPGCSIISAVEEQKIARQRWQNYCRIIASNSD
ncbi:MAG: small ribosomal subunit biogenesis GTPase RsgA [Kangiellaceae bacterium]|nr:small ribosomal subunit biogenesis GTPase RsgA [Kangiellaceae bacterium]MCW8999974.1 small ribosomal subunit biogenesis GTPase RsgA [Kangiellaceae bacterium]